MYFPSAASNHIYGNPKKVCTFKTACIFCFVSWPYLLSLFRTSADKSHTSWDARSSEHATGRSIHIWQNVTEYDTFAVLLTSSGSPSSQAIRVTWVTCSTGLVRVSNTWLSCRNQEHQSIIKYHQYTGGPRHTNTFITFLIFKKYLLQTPCSASNIWLLEYYPTPQYNYDYK